MSCITLLPDDIVLTGILFKLLKGAADAFTGPKN